MHSSQDSAENVQLARHLGLFEAVMIGVGAMIGAGIFVLTGIASGLAGPAAIIAFGLNGVVTLFTAFSYAELSSAIPEAGGGYAFVKKVMPNSVAFISGWMLWFAYVVACSLYAKGFGSYFLEFFERYVPSITHFLVGTFGHGITVAILTLIIGMVFLAINIIGTHASGKTEDVITLLKIIILGIFIYYGVKAVLQAPEVTSSNFSPMFPNGFSGVIAAMGLTFIAFEGYDLIATVSEEVKNPEKTIPKAIMYSLGITIVIYLLVVFVSLGAVPPEGGVPTWQMLGNYGEIGIVQAAQNFMPKVGVILVLGGGLFATLSALNATIMASSRVAFSMGRDWMLPNTLSRIHSIRKTPVMAISVTGILFLIVAIFLPLETIGTASSLLFLLTFTLVNASLIMYRRRSSKSAPFQVPFYPVTPILGIVTSIGISFYQLLNEGLAWALAAVWIMIGLVIYIIFFSKRASIAEVPKVIETPGLLSLKNIKGYKILVPLANPERTERLIKMSGRIADVSQGEVIALTVVDLPDVTAYSEAEPFMNEGRLVLNMAQKAAITEKISLTTLMKVGRSASQEIINVAKENNCDLILMGYKKEEDPLENSIIHHVISRQPCDVAILKSAKVTTGAINNVLLPIAGKEVHDNLKVRLAHSLYRSSQCTFTFLTVVPPGAGSNGSSRAEESLKRAAKIYNLPDVKFVTEENDNVAKAIISNASDKDLLLLGMRDEPWLDSFFFGTVAQQVAGQVECPTLLTKAHSSRKDKLRRLFQSSKSNG